MNSKKQPYVLALAVCVATGCVPALTSISDIGSKQKDQTGATPGPSSSQPLAVPTESPTPAPDLQVFERAKARRAAWVEPKDIDEAVQRLSEVRTRLKATGKVILRYNEAELKALAKYAPVPDERYLVRLVAYDPKDTDKLGRPREFGKMTLWAATYEQLESADSDPELLNRLLGMSYDPRNSYYLLVLRDFGGDPNKRPEMICPTWEKILELAKRDLANEFFSAADFDAVAEAYKETYRNDMAAFYKANYKEYAQSDVDAFVSSVPALKNDARAQRLFRTRLRLHAQYGANEMFRGDGLTLFLGDQPRKAGVQEIFLLDPDPKPIGDYVQNGQVRKLKCEPLVKDHSFVFEEWTSNGNG